MNASRYIYTFITAAVLLWACSDKPEALQYPQTAKVDHVDTYFGVEVPDPYRWLEADTAQEVAEWVRQQNELTFAYLSKIPFRDFLKKRLETIRDHERFSQPERRGNRFFFMKNDGLQNQSVLYMQEGAGTEAVVLLDPNTFSEDGSVYLQQTEFSLDGRYLAYSISRGGSDWREIFVMDVDTREKLADHIQWVKFSGIAWQDHGFYYSRYDEPDEATKLSAQNNYHKVYYHTVGEAQSDDRLIYKDDENPGRLHYAGTTTDGKYEVLGVRDHRYRGVAWYLREYAKGGEFRPILPGFEHQNSIVDHINGKFLVTTNVGAARNRLVAVDPAHPEPENWQTLIPESKDVLTDVEYAGGKLFVFYLKDVSTHVYVYNTDGVREGEIALPGLGTVRGLRGLPDDSTLFYTFTSFTTPTTIYEYDVATATSKVFRKPVIDFDVDAYATEQIFYKSKDGTPVPMFIVHKKNVAKNGQNPTLLTAYGGFGQSHYPGFSTGILPFLEQGGIYAVANIRGGGEYGEEWHEAAVKEKRQVAFNDFIAAAETLIERKYTSSAKLAIQGGSNGGLLVGAVMNQRPELFGVAIPQVGVMDMLRFHKFTIGRMWTREYGSSEDSSQFHYLFGYSPLHNIKSGVDYPATLVTTADHDDRVVPAHSFKYIATLQERHTGPRPTLIRIETQGGHGGGGQDMYIASQADILSFILYEMEAQVDTNSAP